MAGAPMGGGQAVPAGQAMRGFAVPGQSMATPNINDMAAKGIMGAGMGTAMGMGFDPGTLATSNIQQYQNPYTQQVIDTSMQDLERQRQMQMNQLGAQATAAGAFGGSRQGVAESLTNEAFARQGGQLAAGLRQAGFQNAQGMAQQDIQNRLAGGQFRLGAANQLGALSQAGFGMGQQALAGLQQTGAAQQMLNQGLIDAARGQFEGYTQAPVQSLEYVSRALGATPTPQTTTATKNPGLFDYLTLALA